QLGVSSVVVMPAKVGVRSNPVVKVGPLDLALSQQMRLRRMHGSRAYVEATKELRIEVSPEEASPKALLQLLDELMAVTAQ
ncbi:MAG: hypothetical protein ABSE75_11725, partial [Acidimicrobiales bacterium]